MDEASSDSVSGAVAYAILTVVSGLFVSIWMSPNETLIKGLLFVCVAAIFVGRLWTMSLILFLIQVGLFLAEPGSLGAYAESPGSSLLAMAVLALLISSSRYLALTSLPVSYRLNTRESARMALMHLRREPRDGFASFGVLPRAESTVGSAELLTTLLRIAVAVIAVSMLLELVPLEPDSPAHARLIPPAVRTISLVVILLLVWMLINGLMNVLVWRRLSPVEARVFLRSELSKWIHREVSSVSRRRIRFRATRRN